MSTKRKFLYTSNTNWQCALLPMHLGRVLSFHYDSSSIRDMKLKRPQCDWFKWKFSVLYRSSSNSKTRRAEEAPRGSCADASEGKVLGGRASVSVADRERERESVSGGHWPGFVRRMRSSQVDPFLSICHFRRNLQWLMKNWPTVGHNAR